MAPTLRGAASSEDATDRFRPARAGNALSEMDQQPPPDVPEADALEQRDRPDAPNDVPGEVPEADVLEQRDREPHRSGGDDAEVPRADRDEQDIEVPVDDEEDRGPR